MSRHPGAKQSVLFISHDASRTGAPMFLLHLLRWIQRNTPLEFEILLGKGGPLEAEFAKIAPLQTPEALFADPSYLGRFSLIYSNTSFNSRTLQKLPANEIPIVTHLHELDLGFHSQGARAMAAMIAQTSHFIGCSQAVVQRLHEVFSIPEDRMSLHYEMIDGDALMQKQYPDAAAVRARFDIPKDVPLVVACGTLDFRKSGDLFVQVAAKIKQRLGESAPVHFVWMGNLDTPGFLSFIQHDVRKLGLSKMLQFVEEQPDPHALMSACDVFCLTSREDPFPLVMLEAGIFGKPVVTFNGSGGAREFCAMGGGLSVPYIDVDAMAAKVVELLRNPELRSQIGTASASLVAERFVVGRVAPEIYAKLQGFLSGQILVSRHWKRQATYAQVYQTWNIQEAPQRAVIEAHLERQRVRENAKAMIGGGQRQEGLNLLARTARTVLGSKEPLIVYESLTEIAGDLAALEPQMSRALTEAAKQVWESVPKLRESWVDSGPCGGP